MLTRDEARAIATAHIGSEALVIIDDHTIERDWGWVFFYQSRRYTETDDRNDLLAGNAPLIVERHSGRLIETGTARPTEWYIANYEATGDPHQKPGREVELLALHQEVDIRTATRLLSGVGAAGLGKAKRALDDLALGRRSRFTAVDRDGARSLCDSLRSCGVDARQIPEGGNGDAR